MNRRWTSCFLTLIGAAALMVLLGMLVPSAKVKAAIPSPTAPDHTEAITRAIAYLRTQQLDNGALPGYGGSADPFTTIKGVIALAASGAPSSALEAADGTTMVDYLALQAITYTHDASGTLLPARAGMLAVAVVAADADPTDFGGMDLIAELTATYHANTGAYSTTATAGWTTGAASTLNQAWAILGLSAAQQAIPLTATTFLLNHQESDGGWGYGFGGDVDTTALVIQALLAGGHITPTHPALQAAEAFLHNRQDDEGAWGYTWGGTYTPSPDSTAAAIQALVALGYTPATYAWTTANGGDPHTALAAMQAPDGSFSGNALGTAHAIAGLAEAPLPLFGAEQRARQALTELAAHQRPDGAWSGWDGSADPGGTVDVVLAFAAAGYDPHTVRMDGGTPSAMDYLSSTAATYAAHGPDAAGKLVMAVVAAGDDPHAFGGVDLIPFITAAYTESDSMGGYGTITNTWLQALAILGLRAAGEPVPITATRTLSALQQSDGGWKYDLSPAFWNTTSPDNTAIALEALIAAGLPAESDVITQGIAFLATHRTPAGDWGNPNSTAFAIQALLAAGEPPSEARWHVNERWPIGLLEGYQKPEGTFFYPGFGEADNDFATRQAIPALLRRPFPLAPRPLHPWQPVPRLPDSDRLVVGQARCDLTTQTLIIPYGSDLNQNGYVTLTWRSTGGSWSPPITIAHTAATALTTTCPLSGAGELRLFIADPDGVQGAREQHLALYRVMLPLIMREP